MVEIKEIKLKNGFRVVAVDSPGRYGAIAELFVQIGSKYENTTEAGVSHFMEHMAFKGTVKRPSAMELNKELDGKGSAAVIIALV